MILTHGERAIEMGLRITGLGLAQKLSRISRVESSGSMAGLLGS